MTDEIPTSRKYSIQYVNTVHYVDNIKIWNWRRSSDSVTVDGNKAWIVKKQHAHRIANDIEKKNLQNVLGLSDGRLQSVANTYGKSVDEIKDLSLFDMWSKVAVHTENGRFVTMNEIKDVYMPMEQYGMTYYMKFPTLAHYFTYYMQVPHGVLNNFLNGHIFSRTGDARAGLDDDFIIPLFDAEVEDSLDNPDLWTLEAYSNAGFDIDIYSDRK